MANIGKSVVFKGDLSGDEDLELEGRVEGQINLPNHQLTIGAHGHAEAEIQAKTVIVTGHVVGNVMALERCEIQASGVVDGDIRAPKLLIQEGAVVNGGITMGEKAAGEKALGEKALGGKALGGKALGGDSQGENAGARTGETTAAGKPSGDTPDLARRTG